ncbi:MAG: hypothetical protein GXO91_00575 [FCB group bacterium]|nr:hypothetical protein [FCB group bacterium]
MALRQIDRDYAAPPLDPRFVGFAKDHWVELDFGDKLKSIGKQDQLVLYLYGWVEYTYSHVNFAAYQAGITLQPPSIEMPDGHGGWQVVVQEAGFPAGLPRMMTLDISRLPLEKSGKLRIRTNMEIYWDQIFAGVDVCDSGLRRTILQPVAAELRQLGYPREYSPDGKNPTLYDYQRIDTGVPFKNMTGKYTRFGDVRELLETVDDEFVIMGHGEEIALEFSAEELPALPEGWTRTFVLHSDGYCKDMDLYTAYPNTIGPLPYHGMANYPPEFSDDDDGKSLYRQKWNTRIITGY